MDIGIVGGGINGLCCAWQLAKQGHKVQIYERDALIKATSSASSKLLHGGLDSPYELDLVRGSRLLLEQPCKQAYLLEAPNDRRIFFVLSWQGNTLVGTTEIRQTPNEPIACSIEEQSYLLNAWSHYFLRGQPKVIGTFADVRPLLRSAQDPTKTTSEYATHRTDKLVTVFGGKLTTALALADKVTTAIH